ncbi:MAG: pyrroloquinoline-quinone synthase PqqC [Thaumarchaeota archaeon]|nr:pyrroloquinoline-quinone synthase PqqC [Nitrososphaerota archaeon]
MNYARSPLDRETFIQKLRGEGNERFHTKHPFNRMMFEGKLTKTQVRAWIVNMFYYQLNIPMKDAAIISNCPIPEVRRFWISRILEHDGYGKVEGGITGWLKLGEAAGIPKDDMISARFLPGVRFSVDSYVNFARTRHWVESVAASLSDLFYEALAERVKAFEKHYRWVKSEGLGYFRSRLIQTKRDSNIALDIAVRYCDAAELQKRAIDAVSFKNDVLWSISDALYTAYVVNEVPLSASF